MRGIVGLPTPVFVSGELHGQRSLMGYSPWGRKMSEQLTFHHTSPPFSSALCYL